MCRLSFSAFNVCNTSDVDEFSSGVVNKSLKFLIRYFLERSDCYFQLLGQAVRNQPQIFVRFLNSAYLDCFNAVLLEVLTQGLQEREARVGS